MLWVRARSRLLVVAAVAALWLVVASLVITLHPELADRVDRSVGVPLAAFADRHEPVEETARVVATVFRYPTLFLVTAVVAVAIARKGLWRPAIWIVVVSLAAALTTTLLKLAFARPRPDYAHMHLRDFGYPSGHATNNACAAGLAIVLAALFVHSPVRRRLVAAVALSLALVVGLDRLLLGVHGLLDVLSGYAVATLWVTLGVYLVDPDPGARGGTSRGARPETGPRAGSRRGSRRSVVGLTQRHHPR
jgi:undecaprenyl-diphosphatase